jgi:hypothetical protein
VTAENSNTSLERVGIVTMLGSLALPIGFVVLRLARVPAWWAAVLLLAGLALSVRAIAPRLDPVLDGSLRRRPVLATLWIALCLFAAFETARVAAFSLDRGMARHGILATRSVHSLYQTNLLGYVAASMQDATVNVYQRYRWKLDAPIADEVTWPFAVTQYQYPPPFLLLPRLFAAVSFVVAHLRPAWFAFEAAAMLYAMIALACWIGGRRGLAVAMLIPAVWAPVATSYNLQVGNFQIVAVAAAIVAMISFHRARSLLGGALLAFVTVSKLAPGILLIELAIERRWRALVALAAWSAAFCAATWMVYGPRPFGDFVHYELPRLSSGEAFVFMRFVPWTICINHSVFAIPLKLEQMSSHAVGGVAEFALPPALLISSTSWSIARVLSKAYGLGLLAVVAWTTWRRHGSALPTPPIERAQRWLAMLYLASLTSGFVHECMAIPTALWLGTLLVVDRSGPKLQALFVLCFVSANLIQAYDQYLFGKHATLVFTLAVQLLMTGLSFYALLRRRPSPAATA